MNTENYESQNKMTANGVVFKSVIGILIAFGIAIPNLFSGNYAFSFIYAGGGFSDFLMVTLFTIVIGIIWFALFKALAKDKGVVLNWIIYVVTMILLGLFFGNSLIVAAHWISYYGNISEEMLQTAVRLAGLATFFAVISGIIVLPKIKMNERTAKIATNLGMLVAALALVQFVMIVLGLFLSIFGITFIWDIYGSIFYGANLLSIILTFITSIVAVGIFVGVLGAVKYQIARAPKHMEFYFSALLVNGLIRIYIELFKLILKIMARRNR